MKSLYKFVDSHLEVEKHSEAFFYVYAESVLYLVRSVGAFQYQEIIKPFCKQMSAKKFRLILQDHRETNLQLKVFAIRLAKFKSVDRQQALALATELEVSKSDALCVMHLLKECAWFARDLKAVAKEVSKTNEHLTLKGVTATFNRVYPRVLKFIKFKTYQKLRFLVKANNETYEDFHNTLLAKITQSFYSLIPIDHTDDYIVNYLKQSVTNAVTNLIKHHTTKKRGRLVNLGTLEKPEFSLLCASDNQMRPVYDESGNEVTREAADSVNSSHRFELQFSISEVVNSVKRSSKKYRFLMILLGQEDSGFSDWLRSHKHCKPLEDNVDVQHRVDSWDFNKLIADFLRVSHDKLARFIDRLKGQLAFA